MTAIRTFSCALALAMLPAAAVYAAAAPSRPEIYFRLANPCPSTGQASGACAGYVVDRITPLVCGGVDEPSNMQWLTTAEAKAKDKWKRIGCRPGRKQV